MISRDHRGQPSNVLSCGDRYNHVSGESSWEKPKAVEKMQQAAIEKAKGKWEKMRKSSMRLKRIGEWIQYCVDGGNVFFYNETTGEFQWERPIELANAGEGGAGELEASPWCAYKDPATGMTFYHNATSGASQWERPEGFGAPDHNDAGGGAAEVDARDLHEVHSVDDLGI